MLTVHFETDPTVIGKLCGELGVSPDEKCSNFVLREDGDPIGLMRTNVGETVRITYFNIVNRAMNLENREFFFRAMLFKFSLNPVPLEVEGEHKELEKFGFVYEGGSMKINSADIVFAPRL